MPGTLLGTGCARRKRVIKDETHPEGANSPKRRENKHTENYVIECHSGGGGGYNMLWTISNSRIMRPGEDGETGVTLAKGQDSTGREGQPRHSHPMPGMSGEW